MYTFQFHFIYLGSISFLFHSFFFLFKEIYILYFIHAMEEAYNFAAQFS